MTTRRPENAELDLLAVRDVAPGSPACTASPAATAVPTSRAPAPESGGRHRRPRHRGRGGPRGPGDATGNGGGDGAGGGDGGGGRNSGGGGGDGGGNGGGGQGDATGSPERAEPAGGGRKVGGLASRASWNLIDQILSALTNFALSFVVARAVDARGFGAFAVGFLVFSVAIGAERALVGQPMSIRFAAAGPAAMRVAVGAATATAVTLGAAIGGVMAACGLLTSGSLRSCLLAMALVMPGLLLQDVCRMIFFAQRRPAQATANDAVWAGTQTVGVAVLLVAGVGSPWPFILVWGGAAAVAALVGLWQLAATPHLRGVAGWITQNASLAGYLLAEFILGSGAYQGGVLLVGAFVGVGDIGSLRAAQVLLGPLSIIGAASMTFLLPEVSRRAATRPELRARPEVRLRLAFQISGGLSCLAFSYAAIILLIPDSVGVRLLGDTWTGASSVLLATAVGSVAAIVGAGPGVLMYGLGQARTTFRIRIFEAPVMLGSMLGGVWAGGTVGAAWGVAAVFILMVPIWYWRLARVKPPVEEPDREAGDVAEPVRAAAPDPARGDAAQRARPATDPGAVSARIPAPRAEQRAGRRGRLDG